jgi:cytochrome c-type biogenesis protein CcmH/NrfF
MAPTKSNAKAWLTGAALALLAIGSLMVPRAHADHSDRAKVVGMRLMCMCGCNQVLIQCNHINCPSSAPMLKELEAHISTGQADDLVVQAFVQEYGDQVLSSPPNRGFNSLAVLLPGIAFVLGLGLVTLVIMQWRKQIPVTASARRELQSKVSPDTLARARDLADRETED